MFLYLLQLIFDFGPSFCNLDDLSLSMRKVMTHTNMRTERTHMGSLKFELMTHSVRTDIRKKLTDYQFWRHTHPVIEGYYVVTRHVIIVSQRHIFVL